MAGQGLIGVAKDNYDTGGRIMSYAIGFAEVEVDTETGAVRLKDYKVASDAGTIINPRTLRRAAPRWGRAGLRGGARAEVGLRPAVGAARVETVLLEPSPRPFSTCRTSSRWTGSRPNEPDPFNPLGARGIGEAPQGAGYRRRLCAPSPTPWVSEYFNRTPIMTDMILTKIEGLPESVAKLAAHA